MNLIDLVEEFHRAHNHPVKKSVVVPDAKLRLLRVKLIMEEACEFAQASGFPCEVMGLKREKSFGWKLSPLNYVKPEDENPDLIDVVEAADGLGDIDYVVQGAALVWGFPQQAITEEIHRSNMSKLGADGKPIVNDTGKSMKGPNYFKPNIEYILRVNGWKGPK